ncbi:MAG TPA: hypothetical protein VHS06_02395, partial [Chloroflexota bacterium]|nr:hypothetical protein [Chloroflexota bacterium]
LLLAEIERGAADEVEQAEVGRAADQADLVIVDEEGAVGEEVEGGEGEGEGGVVITDYSVTGGRVVGGW